MKRTLVQILFQGNKDKDFYAWVVKSADKNSLSAVAFCRYTLKNAYNKELERTQSTQKN